MSDLLTASHRERVEAAYITLSTLTTGIEKEFDLSIEEVNASLKWYDTKDAGSGPAKFAIDKHSNKVHLLSVLNM